MIHSPSANPRFCWVTTPLSSWTWFPKIPISTNTLCWNSGETWKHPHQIMKLLQSSVRQWRLVNIQLSIFVYKSFKNVFIYQVHHLYTSWAVTEVQSQATADGGFTIMKTADGSADWQFGGITDGRPSVVTLPVPLTTFRLQITLEPKGAQMYPAFEIMGCTEKGRIGNLELYFIFHICLIKLDAKKGSLI